MNSFERINTAIDMTKLTATHYWSLVFMTNDNGNNETLVIHGLSGSVLKCQLRINSELLKIRITITRFLNVIGLEYMLLYMFSTR